MSPIPMSSPKQELRRLLKDYERHQKQLNDHIESCRILKEKIGAIRCKPDDDEQQLFLDWHEHHISAEKAVVQTDVNDSNWEVITYRA